MLKRLLANQKLQTQEFYHLFQPIYDLHTFTCIGYEALLRSPTFDPKTLFNIAIKNQQKYELDLFSAKHSMETFRRTLESINQLLFVNVFPSTIIRSYWFSQLCEWKYENVPHDRIVLEMNESEEIEDLYAYQNMIHRLKDLGYRIAVDDVGKGKGTLSALTMIEPHIIKLDQWFAEGLCQSKEKQNYVERMVRFCGNDVQLILEGMETLEDVEVAQGLGIRYGQGYFLGRPQRLPFVKEKANGGMIHVGRS